MEFQFTPYMLPFAGAAFILALLLRVAWNYRRDPVAEWFAATSVALIIWAVGYCLEIAAVGLQQKVFFANVQFLGVATVSVCWWEMVRRHLDIRRVPRQLTWFLWLVAAATVVISFSNPAHIFRGIPFIDTVEAPIPILHADYGPWYSYVLAPVTLLLDGAVLALLARAIIRAKRVYRRQFILLFIALLLPLVGSALYVAGFTLWKDYNLTVALSGLSGVLMGMGLFRWRLFSIIPLAHDRVIENLADGVIVVDRRGSIVDLNRSAGRILGLRRDKVFGRSASDALSQHPVLLEILAAAKDDLVEGVPRRDMVIKRDDVRNYFALSSSMVEGERGESLGCTVIMHDVTERVRLFEQVRELANKDDLTALPNHRHFFLLATREFERARRYRHPVSLLVIDIDHFKQINDTYGHRAGDRLLNTIARTCRRELRASDIIGRVGGEEFAVVLPETDIGVAMEVANRVRMAIESVAVGADQPGEAAPTRVTISVGAAQAHQEKIGDLETLDSAYERADRALYEAKKLGRNAVVASAEAPALRAAV